MPPDKDAIRFALDSGASAEDLLTTLAPGSAFDRLGARLTCEKCFKTETYSFRQLDVAKWTCACGTALESKPLLEEGLLFMRGHPGPYNFLRTLPVVGHGGQSN